MRGEKQLLQIGIHRLGYVKAHTADTYSATKFSTCQPVGTATKDLGHAPPKIAGHEAVDDWIQGAVRVSQEQAIGEGVRGRCAFPCEQF